MQKFYLCLLVKKYTFIVLAISLMLQACNSDALVDRYHDIPEAGWQYEQVVTDSFEVVKSDHYHQISANIRVTGDYPYANIHMKATITDPDGKSTEYKVPMPLAEKSGKWLGTGLGDVITFQTPILHRKLLTKKGKYSITIAQDMRLETLKSIRSAGVKVEQQEEIY
jgi:gliding motility-associated lipoprotein GldH